MSDDPNTTLESARQHVREALEQFVKDPASDGYQDGFLAALYVIGREGLGMDLDDPPMAEAPKHPVSHLRLVT